MTKYVFLKYFSSLPLFLTVLDGVQTFVIEISCAATNLAILMDISILTVYCIVLGSIWKDQGNPCIHADCSSVVMIYMYVMFTAAKNAVLQRPGGRGITRCCMVFYYLQSTAWCWSSCVANLVAYHHSSSLSLCYSCATIW